MSIRAYDTYLSLKAPDDQDLLAYVDLLLMARQSGKARTVVRQMLQAGGRHHQALLIAARCARLDGCYDEARDHLREAIENYPAFEQAWQLLLEIVSDDELPKLATECTRLFRSGAGKWQELASQYAARVPTTNHLLIDKMPHNARHVGLACAMFPSARVIYLQRDPRDVCLSIYSRFFPDGHRYACDLTWLAHFYAQTARLMEHWTATLRHRILDVRYEDLIDSPVSTMQKVAEFCGLTWQPGCLRFHENVEHSHTMSETQVRRPLNRQGIGRWRHYERQLKPLLEALEEYRVL